MAYPVHGIYDFCFDLTDFDGLVLQQDYECQVEVSCELNGTELEVTCIDALKDGVSLRNGGILAKAIRVQAMTKADENLENGGWLFEQVREAEGISLSGRPGDPDAHWHMAAE